jgi:hypothetical protein
MNSQKLLIISVLAALLIIAGAIAFVKIKGGGGSTDLPVTTINGDQIVIDEIMSSCKTNDQCIVVDTKCSFCCDYVAINAKSETLFNQMFDQACKKYKGSYCDCHDLTSYPTCVNGKCQMVKWSENKPLKAPPATAAQPTVQQPAAQPITQQTPAVTPAPVQQQIPQQVAPAPVTAPTPAPEPVPAQQPVQQTAPAAVDAFGEEEAVPAQDPAAIDDLYAPLPDTYTPPPAADESGVHVIQP